MGSRDNAWARKVGGATAPPHPSPPLGAAILSDAAWTEITRSLKLTPRELQMTRGVFDNLTEGAIAAEVGISEHTTHRHLNRLFKKLRVTTRAQVVLRVMHELLFLTLSDASNLPAICRNRANGRCLILNRSQARSQRWAE